MRRAEARSKSSPTTGIIGGYNPDWGVLRHVKGVPVSLELVRETKGGDDLNKLRFLNEGRKLVLAERYFATLGIDYRFVSPRVDQYWQARGAAVKQRKLAIPSEPTGVAVVVYDLKAAATAFSEGQTRRSSVASTSSRGRRSAPGSSSRRSSATR